MIKAVFHWRWSRSKSGYGPVKIKNERRKRSYKLNGIGVARMNASVFFRIRLNDSVNLSQSKAEGPTNHNHASSHALRVPLFCLATPTPILSLVKTSLKQALNSPLNRLNFSNLEWNFDQTVTSSDTLFGRK